MIALDTLALKSNRKTFVVCLFFLIVCQLVCFCSFFLFSSLQNPKPKKKTTFKLPKPPLSPRRQDGGRGGRLRALLPSVGERGPGALRRATPGGGTEATAGGSGEEKVSWGWVGGFLGGVWGWVGLGGCFFFFFFLK